MSKVKSLVITSELVFTDFLHVPSIGESSNLVNHDADTAVNDIRNIINLDGSIQQRQRDLS